MKAEQAEKFLNGFLTELKKSHKRWCEGDIDDAEEMFQEYPALIHELIPQIEEVLELPISNLIIKSAIYGSGDLTKDVKNILETHLSFNDIELRIDNHSMGSDPAPNRVKELKVVYSFNGQQKEIIIIEGNTLKLP